ncbi:hypothetical protein EW145_g967 [Phellinidium pouzarii]|uniref:BHLH domain-containing protein n=1 Tax=Phellinidium pouzarii TaxID=167371 RepID=A0A4S4LI50_9AGAM|nr:hypothetical protein EW145_g967 [Phellinidium pouzarii]
MDHHHHQHQHQHHPHPQEHIDMQHDPALAQAQYGFYAPEPTDPAYAQMPFAHQMPNYEVVPSAHPPRQMSANELQQAFQFRNLGLMSNHQYPNPVYPPSSPPPNLNLPLSSSSPPPPQSPAYDPLSPPISGSDTSADGAYISRNSSGTTSPSSSRGGSLVHRNPLRYNPTPSPSSSSGRRGRGRSIDSDEDDQNNMMSVVQEIAHNRKEATRKQRIEAEQRRRDELRDGYARLKDVLPVSNQKSSKVSLLERATNYITQLDKSTRQMQTRLAALESEVQRLRSLNEKISLSVGSTPEATSNAVGQPMVHTMERPLSPPPEGVAHNLVPVTSEPPHENSSGSEGGF